MIIYPLMLFVQPVALVAPLAQQPVAQATAAQPTWRADITARDAAQQQRGVEAATSVDPAELLRLWRETDRFDVRAAVARALAARGDDGAAALLTLCRENAFYREPEAGMLIEKAVGSRGPGALALLEAETTNEGASAKAETRPWGRFTREPSVNALAAGILQAAKVPIEQTARAWLDSSNPHLRAAAWRLYFSIPQPARSEFILADRGAPGFIFTALGWTATEAALFPREHAAFVDGVNRLLATEAETLNLEVVLSICDAMQQTNGSMIQRGYLPVVQPDWSPPPAVLARLQREAIGSQHNQAARVVLRCQNADPAFLHAWLKMRQRGIESVSPLTALEGAPDAVIAAITDEEAAVIASDPPSWGVWEPSPHPVLMERLGARAVPSLVSNLKQTRYPSVAALASHWLAILAQRGVDVSAAIPVLIDRLKRLPPGENGRCGGTFARALLTIAPNDQATHQTIESLIARAARNWEYEYPAGETLELLVRTRPDDPWVAALVATVSTTKVHKLNGRLRKLQGLGLLRPTDEEQNRHAVTLNGTAYEPYVRAALKYEQGPLPTPPPPEDDASPQSRAEAVGHLTAAKRLTPEARAALLHVLTRPLTAEVLRAAEADPYTHAPWAEELATIRAVMRTLIARMEADDALRNDVFAALKDTPDVAIALLAVLNTDPPWHIAAANIAPPPDSAASLTAHLTERLADPLAPTPRVIGDLRAVPRVASTDPAVVRLLVQLIRFGPGEVPAAAMQSLGSCRPFTPALLEVVREGLGDPRISLRTAAVNAACEAGPDAAPLVPDVIRLGDWLKGYADGVEISRILRLIAPLDPKAQAYIKTHTPSSPLGR